MNSDFEENKRKKKSTFRSMYDYTMGVLWIVVGVFFLWHRKLGYDLDLDQTLTGIFGVSSLMYGLFRIYRGYKV